MASTQLIHKLEEYSFECKFCKKDFAYLITDWYYHSMKQSDCHRCAEDIEESFDNMDICADCFIEKSPNGLCEDCRKEQPDEIKNGIMQVHNYCEYCEKYLGSSFVADPDVDDIICKDCGLDLDKDGKSRVVCSDCRNNLN